MSQENVELTHRASDAFNRRDLGAFLELMDDDVEYVPRAVAMEGRYHGHDGMHRWWENVFGVWPDLATQLVEVRNLGDLTVAAVHFRGQGAGSDIPWDETFWQVARWRRGKCVWWRTFPTRDEALESLGLPE